MKFGLLSTLLVLVMTLPWPHYIINAVLIFNLLLVFAWLVASMFCRDVRFIKYFPGVLLFLHLLVLALNVSAMRLILQGHGFSIKIVEYIGNSIAGAQPGLGLVIFSLLSLIQFTLHNRACTRIKCIADNLNIKHESIASSDLWLNFWKEMRGWAPFAKKLAWAHIIISFINLVGGIVIGTYINGMELSLACQYYAAATVGIGYVIAIQALFLETSTGVVVSAYQKQIGNT